MSDNGERRPLLDNHHDKDDGGGGDGAGDPFLPMGLDLKTYEAAEGSELGVEELMYSANSFCAVLKPVSLTMLLASVAVVYCKSTEDASTSQSLDAYTVYDEDEDSGDTASVRLGKSMINALLIVCVLAAATFGRSMSRTPSASI